MKHVVSKVPLALSGGRIVLRELLAASPPVECPRHNVAESLTSRYRGHHSRHIVRVTPGDFDLQQFSHIHIHSHVSLCSTPLTLHDNMSLVGISVHVVRPSARNEHWPDRVLTKREAGWWNLKL